MLPIKLQSLRDRASLYVQPVSYETVSACVMGYDLAMDFDFLRGFREWLKMKVSDGHNMAWPNMILFHAFSDAQSPLKMLTSDEANQHAISCLFDQIDEFLIEREETGLQPLLDLHSAWASQRRNS